jgi:hypothetical protein
MNKNIKDVLLLSLTVLSLAGCADNVFSLASQPKALNAADGISIQEARMIARDALKGSEYIYEYRPNTAVLVDNYMSKDYPGFWFVAFANRQSERSFWEFLVVISKQDGSVYAAAPYVPMEVFSYDWIFKKDLPVTEEEVIYKKHVIKESAQ